MKELTSQELLLINGGSQESYENGQEAGEKAKDFVDDCSRWYFVVSVAVLIIFHVKI